MVDTATITIQAKIPMKVPVLSPIFSISAGVGSSISRMQSWRAFTNRLIPISVTFLTSIA